MERMKNFFNDESGAERGGVWSAGVADRGGDHCYV